MSSNLLILIGRIFLSVLFIMSGFAKLTGLAGTAQFFAAVGLPAPMIVAVLVGLLELFGGLAILVGFKTRVIALVIPAEDAALFGERPIGRLAQLAKLTGRKLELAVEGGSNIPAK